MPRIVGTVCVVVGIIAIVVGVGTYLEVRQQLSDQHITVSKDAPFLSGWDVKGPLTAYAQARALNKHALEAGGGKTYAELPQDDPARSTVVTADFLQTSLYTSVVAFGVALLIVALGAMFILVGLAFKVLDRRTMQAEAAAEATLVAA
jgi:hypothetical protein